MRKKLETAGKQRMRLSAFVLALCLSVSAAWADAAPVLAAEQNGGGNSTADEGETFEVDGVTYQEIGPGKAELTNGKGLSGDIAIPENVSHNGVTYTVVSIGTGAFYNIRKLTSVSFPDTVTRIRVSAFDSAFQDGCDAGLTLPPHLTVIDSHAFYENGLGGHLDIPDSVTDIEYLAFYKNDFETITIHSPNLRMGERVFEGNIKLTAVTLSRGLICLASRTFSGCTKLAEVTLPDTLREIGDNAFNGCTGLERVALPDSLRTLAVCVFEGCTGLREVIIPEGVTQIPRNCFAGCKNLTVTLPDTVKTVDAAAFQDVSGLTVKCTGRRAALEACNAGVQNILLNGAAFEPYGETAFGTSEYQFAVTDDENRTVRLTQYAGGGI